MPVVDSAMPFTAESVKNVYLILTWPAGHMIMKVFIKIVNLKAVAFSTNL